MSCQQVHPQLQLLSHLPLSGLLTGVHLLLPHVRPAPPPALPRQPRSLRPGGRPVPVPGLLRRPASLPLLPRPLRQRGRQVSQVCNHTGHQYKTTGPPSSAPPLFPTCRFAEDYSSLGRPAELEDTRIPAGCYSYKSLRMRSPSPARPEPGPSPALPFPRTNLPSTKAASPNIRYRGRQQTNPELGIHDRDEILV